MNINVTSSPNVPSPNRPRSGRSASWRPVDYWLQHLRPGFKVKPFTTKQSTPPPQPEFRNGTGKERVGPPRGNGTGRSTPGSPGGTIGDLSSTEFTKELEAKLSELRKATDSVESLLARQLVDAMQKAAPEFAKGPMASLATESFAETMSENLSKTRAFGISDALFDQLSETLIRQHAVSQDTQP